MIGEFIEIEDDHITESCESGSACCDLFNKRAQRHVSHQQRCIFVLDVDAFYAQVEELREPDLRNQPLAVFQKFLVITCNYVARARGITKLMKKDEALARCPGLVFRSAEDTTPYRHASRNVQTALEEWAGQHDGVVVGKLGMDEFCLDVSSAAAEVVASTAEAGLSWEGHVYTSQDAVCSAEAMAGRDACYRPMDLRSTKTNMANASNEIHTSGHDSEESLLMAGSRLALQVRTSVYEATGLKTSVGIAANMLLAKLAAGLHKPDAQTALPSRFAKCFLAPCSPAVLPGVGRSANELLHSRGFRKVEQLQQASMDSLKTVFGGDVTAEFLCHLQDLAHGVDSRPVKPTKLPARISVEDSFRNCTTWDGIRAVLHVLAPDLVARLLEDGREPRNLAVTWRHYGSRTMNNPHGDGKRATTRSASLSLPCRAKEDEIARHVADIATKLISAGLGTTKFHLTRINLAVSKFASSATFGGKHAPLMCALSINRGQQSTDIAKRRSTVNDMETYRNDYDGNCPHLLLSKAQERSMREQDIHCVTPNSMERDGNAPCGRLNASCEVASISSDDETRVVRKSQNSDAGSNRSPDAEVSALHESMDMERLLSNNLSCQNVFLQNCPSAMDVISSDEEDDCRSAWSAFGASCNGNTSKTNCTSRKQASLDDYFRSKRPRTHVPVTELF